MAGIAEYGKLIERLITEHAGCRKDSGIEAQIILDRERQHYQLVNIGWQKNVRVRDCVLHLDIKDGKIWVQQDTTEPGIANELAALGVPKEHIVLAFYAPYRRHYTDFAVA